MNLQDAQRVYGAPSPIPGNNDNKSNLIPIIITLIVVGGITYFFYMENEKQKNEKQTKQNKK